MAHPLDAAARKYLHAQMPRSALANAPAKKQKTNPAEKKSAFKAKDPSVDMEDPSVKNPTKGAAGSTKSPRFRPAEDPLASPDKAYGFAKGGKARPKSFVPREEGRLPPAEAPAPELPPNPAQSPALNPNPGGARMPHANTPEGGPGMPEAPGAEAPAAAEAAPAAAEGMEGAGGLGESLLGASGGELGNAAETAGLKALVQKYAPAAVVGSVPALVLQGMLSSAEAGGHDADQATYETQRAIAKRRAAMAPGEEGAAAMAREGDGPDAEIARQFLQHLKRNGGAARNQ